MYKVSEKEFLKFGDVEIEFHSSRSAISIYDANIDKLVISEELSYAKKGS